MQERHLNRKQYFEEQTYTTDKYVIPFIERIVKVDKGMRVMEIGCGEAGNLMPFVDRGCICTGVDLSENKILAGREFYAEHPNKDNITLIVEDIYNYKDNSVTFDIIIMRDVIEHIPDQERFIWHLRNFVHKDTVIFFAFPPWQNPFGGHQQICRSKFTSHLPYFHLLPAWCYRGILKTFKEAAPTVKELLEIKETGISIERFKKIIDNSPFSIRKEVYYFINPNYEIKFKLKPRESYKAISSVRYLRNFFITCMYCLVSLEDK